MLHHRQAGWTDAGAPAPAPSRGPAPAPSAAAPLPVPGAPTPSLGALSAGLVLLRKIFEYSYDAIFVLDPEADRFLDANPRACALVGYTRDELLALPVSAIHPDDLAVLRSFSDDSLADGDGRTHEVSCLSASGKAIPVEVSCSRIEIAGRHCLVCLARDVSERKRVEEALARDRERKQRELAAAAQIQKSLLPHRQPAIPGVRTAWVFRPCEELAGDNLNIVPLDARHIGLYVLDVSGHGVAAALLAVIAQRLLTPSPLHDSLLYRPKAGPHGARVEDPARVVQRLDRQLRPHLLPSQYLTLLYGVLDLETRLFRFASAGHWGPAHLPRSGGARLLHARGFPVGVMEDATYEEYAAELAPGDRLYLYSDGVPEALGRGGEQFDYPRILEVLGRHRRQPLADGLSRLVESVQAWHGGSGLEDDLSVLALEMRPRMRPRVARRRGLTSAAPGTTV